MTIQTSPLIVAFVVIAAGLAALLSFFVWQRSGFRWSTARLELLRLVIVAAALITVLQPEFVKTIAPQEPATIVVLRDRSASMQTRDQLATDNAASAEPQSTTTRWQATSFLDDATWSSKLGQDLKVVVEPFTFDNQQSDAGTDIDLALKNATERFQDLKAVVLVSDGDWNVGHSPTQTAQSLRLSKTPVHTLSVGQPFRLPDVGLSSFDVPAFAVTGKPLRIPFTVESSLATEIDLPVTLSGSDGEPIQQVVRLPAKGTASGTFEFRPKQPGELSLSLSIVPGSADALPDNNTKSVPLTVRAESLKVLVIESYPRWEYRYIRNALQRDPGIDVDCLLLHPELGEIGEGQNYLSEFPSDEKLFAYDVVFLGDIAVATDQAGELTTEQCRSLRRLVESQSGGLVMIPGLRGSQTSLTNSPLADLLPIDFDAEHPRGIGSEKAGHFQLTEVGRASLLTRLESNEAANDLLWRSLPGFYWHAGILRARPGAQVLASHDSSSSRAGRRPLIVTKTFGTGKVLFMASDGAWRWRKGVEDRYHYRFWGQVVRWMAYQRNMAEGQSIRLIYSPDRPKQYEVVTLQANVMTTAGEPLETGTVTAQVVSPGGVVESLRFQAATGDAWGLFTTNFRPQEGGLYRVTVSCKETGAELQASLNVQAVERELVGRPARPEVLQEIATITGGKSFTLSQLDDLVDQLNMAPQVQIIEQRVRLWCHPLWGSLLIGLLSLFWAARKLGGLQ